MRGSGPHDGVCGTAGGPVARHRGIYYRPGAGPDGKPQPPYEVCYYDSGGVRRWHIVDGTLEDAQAKRADSCSDGGPANESSRTGRRSSSTPASGSRVRRAGRAPRRSSPGRSSSTSSPYFGRRRLDQIQVEDVAAFIAVMHRKKLRGSTINTALQPLSMILGHAARRGRIPVNPLGQLERGERPSLEANTQAHPDPRGDACAHRGR